MFLPRYIEQNYNIDDITKIFVADENALKINFYTNKVKAAQYQMRMKFLSLTPISLRVPQRW